MSFGAILGVTLVGLMALATGWRYAAGRQGGSGRRDGAGRREGSGRHVGSGPDPLARAQALVRKVQRTGKVGHLQLFPGLWLHVVPEGADPQAVDRAPAGLVDGGGPVVRFSLGDLLEGDHPAAGDLPERLGLDPAAARLVFTARVDAIKEAALASFGRLAECALEEDAADAPFGRLVVRDGPYLHDVRLAQLTTDAAAWLCPITTLAAERAHAARAELSLYRAFHDTVEEEFPEAEVSVEGRWLVVREPDDREHRFDYRVLPLRLTGGRTAWRAWVERLALGDVMAFEGVEVAPEAQSSDGAWLGRRLRPVSSLSSASVLGTDRGGYAEVLTLDTAFSSEPLPADHPIAGGRSLRELLSLSQSALPRFQLTGHVLKSRGEGQAPRSFTLVGADAASVAQDPALLAGAARAAGVLPAGARVRVSATRERVLVVAESRADAPFLAACRRRAALLLDALCIPGGEALHLDETLTLGEEPVGEFDLTVVDERFLTAAGRLGRARATGDEAGAATGRAMMRLALGDPEGARAHLEEAAALAPEDPEIQLALGTLLNDVGDFARAEQILRGALAHDGENAAVNNNLGVAYQGLGRLAEAALFFEKAAGLRPEDPVVRVNLGRVLFDSGDTRGAERQFKSALGRDRRCIPALTGLVLLAVREGDADLARSRLRSALEAAPADDALLRLHRALHPDEPVH